MPLRLPGPAPVLAAGAELPDERSLKRRQVALLEARSFWWSLLSGMPDTGLLVVDSPAWTALGLPGSYGTPGVTVFTETDGYLAVVPADRSQFAEEAARAAEVAPIADRALLIAAGMEGGEGAGCYAEAWSWVTVAEGLPGPLRIGAQTWWQRRIVGAVGARLFLAAPRGRELAPGTLEVLEGWTRFWTGYLGEVAEPLTDHIRTPPVGPDPRPGLELDARLYRLAVAMADRYALEAVERLRRAWPEDAAYETWTEALDALWVEMPGLREEWEPRLLLIPPEPPPAP
jgi:hypothetical protein